MMTTYIIIGLLVIAVAIAVYVKRKSVKKVPQGIQVFDQNGSISLEVTDRLTQVVQIVDTYDLTGSVYIPTTGDQKVWAIYEMLSGGTSTSGLGVVLTINGNTVYWEQDRSGSGKGGTPPNPSHIRIICGVV